MASLHVSIRAQDYESSSEEESEAEGPNNLNNSAKGVSNADQKKPNNNNDQKLDQTLAREETKRVRRLRTVLGFFLLSAAALVSTFVYLRSHQDQVDAFETQFDDLAQRLVEGFHANAKLRLQTLDQMAVSITSFATYSGQVFPTVTVWDFEARATAVISTLNAHSVGFAPIVAMDKRQEWEDYTVNNSYPWLFQSLAFQEEFQKTHNVTVGREDGRGEERRRLEEEEDGNEETTSELNPDAQPLHWTELGQAPFIFRFSNEAEREALETNFVVEDDDIGYYIPIWEVAPAVSTSVQDVNYNMMDPHSPGFLRDAFKVVKGEQSAVFAGVWNVEPDGSFNMDDDYDLREVPAASVLYPVFDQSIGESKEVAAVLHLDLEFGPYFTSVLPPNSDEIVCVVSTPCGQAFSYRIVGETATYLGAEEMYDPKYKNMMVSALMTDFRQSGTVYTGVPVSEDFCPWTLEVYPTQELEDDFLTSKPIYYTVAVLGVFVFTCAMFLLYDCLQERRQKVVMSTAVKSDKIVSELFPNQFKGRLYDAKKSTRDEKQRDSATGNGPLQNLQALNPITSLMSRNNNSSFLASNTNTQGFDGQSMRNFEEAVARGQSPPLAELYPDCTVFFADIAGFTAWSSSRTPSDVFVLLETLYGAFDKLAEKHSVFKIETIGDCYVAVTGLPVAQPNHALLMTKFSRDILIKASKLTNELERKLGPDTVNLAMRVGLHSGPVTAGILRGQKARFQLFGDSVNTAARMESNGQRSCIHASEETANHLITMGKGHWVVPREEKIHAKGKGELQTYWLKPKPGGQSRVSSHVSSNEDTDDADIEDSPLVDIASAIEALPGEKKHKRKWADQNHKRIGFVVELLAGELDEVDTERGCGKLVEAGGEECWQNKDVALGGDNDFGDLLIKGKSSLDAQSLERPKGLDDAVLSQLFDFVAQVAYLSKVDIFHNFEHTLFVAMAAKRMVQQLKATNSDGFECSALASFAALFAILIRDVKPGATGKDAVNRTWDVLSDDGFHALRRCLCVNLAELKCFWQLVKQFLEIPEESLSSTTEEHWKDAFSASTQYEGVEKQTRQALAALEHVIILSQATHPLQHWDNFLKWSEKLYLEAGNGSSDGAELAWYQHRLDYFDTVLVPTVEKVAKAGFLGALGNEIMLYAQQNRREWETSGQELISSFGVEGGQRTEMSQSAEENFMNVITC